MEFKLLYLKHILIVQCFSVTLEVISDGVKFVKKNQPTTLECLLAKQEVVSWHIGSEKIHSPLWLPVKTEKFEANVLLGEANILNLTLLSRNDITLFCRSTDRMIKYQAKQMYNDSGNLYPSSETPYAIKDKKFTLKCNTYGSGSSTTWYTTNGTVIAKYNGTQDQNYSKYFGSRQETSCQSKSCTLSIKNVTLDDKMSIICSTGLHSSMFNITVFVLPKSVTIKTLSDTIPVENQNKTYECLIKDTKPEYSVLWLITNKDGTQNNATKYISNSSSKSGKLITLSSKLTLTLNRKFKELHCVVYLMNKREVFKYSTKFEMDIIYPPERDNMILNVFGEVCIDTPIQFQCSWKGGNPPARVTLMFRDRSYSDTEDIELSVTPSKSDRTVKCLGTHKVASVSREKDLVIHYPQVNITEEMHTTIINCTAFDRDPATYQYKLKQRWGNVTKNTYDTNVLFLKNSSFNDTGTWECQVNNETVCVSEPTNYEIPVKPILSSISNSLKKRSVSNGESVIFKQCFYSHPKSDVKWKKRGELIDPKKYLTTDYLSSEFPFKGSCTSLKIEDIKDNDFGLYNLILENSMGKKVISFALRFKETTEILLVIVIGCSVGSALLIIILELLAYKYCKIRGVKRNKEEKVGMNPLEDVQKISVSGSSANLEEDEESVYATISDEPNTGKGQYADISDLKYICMKRPGYH